MLEVEKLLMTARKRKAAPVGAVAVQRVSLKKLKPAAYNPRKRLRPGDPEYQRIKRSIEAYGLVDPLVWNKRTGNLVGRHQRLKVLQEMGAAAVDCSVVDLDLTREKALNLALNKVGGAWDEGSLAELLGELRDQIDPAITGFAQAEIDELLAATAAAEESDPPAGPGLVYRIIVDCRSENEQRVLLDQLTGEGLNCRATIS